MDQNAVYSYYGCGNENGGVSGGVSGDESSGVSVSKYDDRCRSESDLNFYHYL